jgi:H+-transporting ATPase
MELEVKDKTVVNVLPEESSSRSLPGLTRNEVEKRRNEFGLNSLPEEKKHIWLVLLKKLWAPVPWMLEISVILELVLGKYIEAMIIGFLIVFNAIISTVQENKAQNALELLKKRLTVFSRVLRDGKWQTVPGSELVPGDIIYLRMGDFVPADAQLITGHLSLDQSSLTGESLPVDVTDGQPVYTGTIVVRGEASSVVINTGTRTRFGKTAQLVQSAKSASQLEKIIFTIAKYLMILDAILVTIALIDAIIVHIPMTTMLPFALILLVASVPVTLPATFTVSTALGALNLTRQGVLVTRLNAIEEAASMKVLCSDKTGTLTENKLEVSELMAFQPYSSKDVLRLAVMASDEATQDPLDTAILKKARSEQVDIRINESRQKYIPFEPATKRSEAIFEENGHLLRVLKGAPQVISNLADKVDDEYQQAVKYLASRGLRVLAIAAESEGGIQIAGLVGFQDPPRADSKNLVARIRELGVRVVMITGDGLLTAQAIAEMIGIGKHACPGESLNDAHWNDGKGCEVYAEVLPEDKFHLVQQYQKAGLTVGMTGDGVNDAPALKQAEVGIAVSTATDVAKAAAGIVLTSPGLSNLVSAIEISRQIYQRMLTYTLNKIIKTIEIVFFLSLGIIFFHTFVTTPLLMILLIFTNDFVTMSISSDNVKPSSQPNQWNIKTIIFGAASLALPILVLSFVIFVYAHTILQLPLANLQTLLFVMLVFSGQGTIYLIRERGHFWRSKPSKWMLLGTFLDILFVGFLASQGILMSAIPITLIGELLLIIGIYLFILDFIKVPIFAKLNLN